MRRAVVVAILLLGAVPLQAAEYHYRVLDSMSKAPGLLFRPLSVETSGRMVGYGMGLNESHCCTAISWSAQDGFGAMPSPVSCYDYVATDSNSSGQAVGTASDTSPDNPGWTYRAIRWSSDGTASELAVPGYQNAQAYAINDAGWSVGFASGDELSNPVIWDPSGNASILDGLRVANDINNQGSIVGWSAAGADDEDPWATIRYADGNTQVLCEGIAHKISNSGTVIGEAAHGEFFWSSATGLLDIWLDIPYLEGLRLTDVNDRGEAVGFYRVWEPHPDMADEPYPWGWEPHMYAFVWSADGGIQNLGKMTGLENSEAFCIDDSGRVYGISSDGLVVWEPVTTPESPGAFSLLSGVGGLVLWTKRQKKGTHPFSLRA